MRKIIFFILLFPFMAIAQLDKEIYLKVIDKTTKEPLPYAHIYWDSIYSGVCNEKGEVVFNKNSTDKNKVSLLITYVGYDIYKKDFDILNDDHIIIELTPRVMELPEIKILSKRNPVKREYGYLKRNGNSAFKYMEGSTVGLLIRPENKSNKLLNISFFITKQQKPNTPFRALLFNRDSLSGFPSTFFIEKDIILQASNKGGEWVTYDLSHYDLQMPIEGIFIAMEWLPEACNNRYSLGDKSCNVDVVSDGQVLGANWIKKNKDRSNDKMVAVSLGSIWGYYFWEFINEAEIHREKDIIPMIKCEILEY